MTKILLGLSAPLFVPSRHVDYKSNYRGAVCAAFHAIIRVGRPNERAPPLGFSFPRVPFTDSVRRPRY